MINLSIIIPVKNEALSIKELYDRINKLELGKKEIIFIDDGSTDNTFEELKKLQDIKIIKFKENQGKAIALTEGFHVATGKYIIMMDGDLQDAPEEIHGFLEKLYTYDCVVGWRKDRQDSKIKCFLSSIYNKISAGLFGLKLNDANCGFKGFRKECLEYLKLTGGLHRYIPFMLYHNGFTVGEQIVKHEKRKYGISKYSLLRFSGFLDLLVLSVYLKRFHRKQNIIEQIIET